MLNHCYLNLLFFAQVPRLQRQRLKLRHPPLRPRRRRHHLPQELHPRYRLLHRITQKVVVLLQVRLHRDHRLESLPGAPLGQHHQVIPIFWPGSSSKGLRTSRMASSMRVFRAVGEYSRASLYLVFPSKGTHAIHRSCFPSAKTRGRQLREHSAAWSDHQPPDCAARYSPRKLVQY